MFSKIDIGNAYFAFATVASMGALAMMQLTTSEAGFKSSVSLLKLAHRFGLAVVSVVLFYSAADTLYNNTDPRPVDFLVIFVLTMVIALSAIRHMAAPSPQSRHIMDPFNLRKS